MPLKYRTPEEMTPDMNIVKMMMIDEPEILDAAIARLPQTSVINTQRSKVRPITSKY